MNREQKERVLDHLLDRALAPEGIEPRPGLEERVAATLRAQPERRSWWQWVWAPALAVVIVSVIGLHLERQPQPRVQPVRAGQPPPATPTAPNPVAAGGQRFLPPSRPDATPRQQQRESRRPATIARMSAGELPRQQVFPSPVPLTPEEQMLLAFVNGNRAEAVLIAQDQQAERERVQKYFETGVDPRPQRQSAPDRR